MPAVTLENKITVNLPSGYRLIRKDDVNKPFYSEDKKMREYKLSYFYDWNRQGNSTVIVKEGKNGLISVIVMFRFVPSIEDPESIVIEMLARNYEKSLSNAGTGSDIIKVVENIARQLNIRSINIEAVSNLVDYYKSLGYTPTGRKYYDSSWDDIVYMKKKLE